jgi:hypothetical protein
MVFSEYFAFPLLVSLNQGAIYGCRYLTSVIHMIAK